MNVLSEKLGLLWPEIALLVGACACLVTGLSGSRGLRKMTPVVAMLAIVVSAALLRLVPNAYADEGFLPGVDAHHFLGLGGMVAFVKLMVLAMGLILVMVATGTPDALKQVIKADATDKKAFEPGDCVQGEFFAFMLFSLTGVMLCAGASDLVWLFLALELTSLPTYVMAATSRDKPAAQEAAVKYFFLGAMSAAVFLFGFALIYGATGYTEFAEIRSYIQDTHGVSPLMLTGVVLAVVGICFKVAAVPMHFYTADVYEGAATPVTAFLAFVPKTAGFVALIGVLGLVGWNHSTGGAPTELPEPLVYLLAGIAVLTMTVGNVLGLMQTYIKRVLAYSSIAHTGYMLVGLLVGPTAAQAATGENTLLSNGIAAVLFYLVAYGLSTVSSFAVIACISKPDGSEVETYDDLAGMRTRHPFLAGVLLVSVISLVGLPPLVGFVGKLYLIGSAYSAASVGAATAWVYPTIVIFMVVNSAISAGYYLRIAAVAFFGEDQGQTVGLNLPLRRWGATIAAAAAFLLGGLPGDLLVESSRHAAEPKAKAPDRDRTTPQRTPDESIGKPERSGQRN